VPQTMYIHISKCKNNKIKGKRKKRQRIGNFFHATP
jgi:hypothetical protein